MAPAPEKNKKKNKAWTSSDELEVISMRDDRGLTWTKIAHEKDMHETTVRSIYAKKEKIKSQGKNKD